MPLIFGRIAKNTYLCRRKPLTKPTRKRMTGRQFILALLTTLAFSCKGWASFREDSLILFRVFDYQVKRAEEVKGYETNVYVKHLYNVERRNFVLWAVPSMHTVARGRRTFLSEQYCRIKFNGIDDYDVNRQAIYSTIPHNRSTMPTLLEFLTPNFHRTTIYGDHILSPFHRENRSYYKYSVVNIYSYLARIYFRPRFVNNTQLVNGKALVDINTGRIIQVEMTGEYDMIRFSTQSMHGSSKEPSVMPRLTKTDIEFRFLGNRITSHFEASFDCPITLPDTLDVRGDRHLIDSIRPFSLTPDEAAVYAAYDSLRAPSAVLSTDSAALSSDSVLVASDSTILSPDSTALPDQPSPVSSDIVATTSPSSSSSRQFAWDDLGENLLRPLKTRTDRAYLRLSPIINPQYLSYSHRKGFSYKMRLRSRFNLTDKLELRFDPTVGYNFKFRKFYYTVPFRLDYYPRREAYVNLVLGNGNRIANNTVLEEIKAERGELPELEGKDLDSFDDMYLRGLNSIKFAYWLTLETGFVFHQRKAVNAPAMQLYGKPVEYRSFAPSLSLKLRPLKHGPVVTIDYERGMKSPRKDHHYEDLEYERWEFDMSMKHRMSRLQTLNLRFGGGFYSHRAKNYFMDYTNFRDNNLPEGWDDDWTGNFQLLSARYYNSSDYYVRGNISYESPLLLTSFVPIVGRYVERERAYVSSILLQTAHRQPYTELGYGFTCRIFSVGAFASFFGPKFEECGAKFTFELFRRW